MAVKQVKDYYIQIEKMYFDLLSSLKEMEEDFKKGECTEEELQNLLTPVNSIKDNYQRLAYIMYLLFQPKSDKKNKTYIKQNQMLHDYFVSLGLTKEQELQKDYDVLKRFKEDLKERFKHE